MCCAVQCSGAYRDNLATETHFKIQVSSSAWQPMRSCRLLPGHEDLWLWWPWMIWSNMATWKLVDPPDGLVWHRGTLSFSLHLGRFGVWKMTWQDLKAQCMGRLLANKSSPNSLPCHALCAIPQRQVSADGCKPQWLLWCDTDDGYKDNQPHEWSMADERVLQGCLGFCTDFLWMISMSPNVSSGHTTVWRPQCSLSSLTWTECGSR